MPEIPAGSRRNRNPLGGFLLHRDCPEDFAPGFCFKFPRWGILRRRTNHRFPQVSRTLHRLTRYALPPERILTQPAPYLRPEGHRFTEHLDKNAGNTFPAFPPYPLSYRRPFRLGRMFADIFAWHPPDTCRLSRSVCFLSAYAETRSFPRYCEKHIWLP